MVNSLRALGYAHRIVVADCGFSDAQRDRLKPHAVLVPLSRAGVKNPQQYKAFAYLLRPRGILVTIDSDIIVTDSIDGMLSSARQGKIGVFPDPEDHRWFAEWQHLFALSGPPRRQTYVNSGFVVFSTVHWPALLERWWNACERIFPQPTIREGAARDSPTSQSDQDALNAILMGEVPRDAVAFQPQNAMVFRWDFEQVRVADERKLRCEFEGTRVVALHAVAGPKPWQRAAGAEATPRNAYVRLLRRLLVHDDAAVRVPSHDLPSWLRPGIGGRLSLAARGWLPKNTGLVARTRRLLRRESAPGN